MDSSSSGSRRRRRPQVIEYSSAARISNVDDEHNSKAGSTGEASASTSNEQPKPVSERRGILLIAAACFFLWCLSAPKILHKAGVIEKDPYEQFLAETVLPSLDRIRADYSNTEFVAERTNRPGYKLKNLGATGSAGGVISPLIRTLEVTLPRFVCERRRASRRLITLWPRTGFGAS